MAEIVSPPVKPAFVPTVTPELDEGLWRAWKEKNRALYGMLEFEKDAGTSYWSVAPTLIAEEMHPGESMPSVAPSLPLAMSVAMPAARRSSIAGFAGSSSHGPNRGPLPRLMFTDAILYVLRNENTY